MKTNLIKLSILLSILFTLAACNTSQPEASQPTPEPTQSITQPVSIQSTTSTQSFTITQVTDNTSSNDEYLGTATDSNEGIYFTSDYIQSVGQLSEGDTISATFDQDGELLSVSKANSATQINTTCEQDEILAEDGSCVNGDFYDNSTTKL